MSTAPSTRAPGGRRGTLTDVLGRELAAAIPESRAARRVEVIALLRWGRHPTAEHSGWIRLPALAIPRLRGHLARLDLPTGRLSGPGATLVFPPADWATLVGTFVLVDRRGIPVTGLPPGSVPTLASADGTTALARAVLLAAGSLTRSAAGTHRLRITCPTTATALLAAAAIAHLSELRPSITTTTDGCTRLLLAEPDALGRLLTALGACRSADELARLVAPEATASPDVFGTANATRATHAAGTQLRVAERALTHPETLPAPLREAAHLRVCHPTASVSALAARADPPASKDAMAGRFRRLTHAITGHDNP